MGIKAIEREIEMIEKKYRKGFTAGVFDLFHVGHLNLLRNCKETCEYLMVGILTDEYTEFLKGRKPYISLKERMEIVRAIRYVDEVVPVDFHNTLKDEACRLYQFDVCYSGNDHGKEASWIEEQRRMKELGADMVFLPYTMSTSSTKIKELISQGRL